jgi:hypothetical protein
MRKGIPAPAAMAFENDSMAEIKEPILSRPTYRKTPARLRAFLEAYVQTGRVYRACEVAGLAPQTHYRKLKDDPVYRRAFESAVKQRIAQRLEAYECAPAWDRRALLLLLKRLKLDKYARASRAM